VQPAETAFGADEDGIPKEGKPCNHPVVITNQASIHDNKLIQVSVGFQAARMGFRKSYKQLDL